VPERDKNFSPKKRIRGGEKEKTKVTKPLLK
jgi:hypothetical protein